MVLKCDYLNIIPSQFQDIPLVKVANFEFAEFMKVQSRDNLIIKDYSINFIRGQYNINMEYVLEISKDILNLVFLFKYFNFKW